MVFHREMMGFMDGVPKVMDGLCHGKSQEIDDLCRGLPRMSGNHQMETWP